MVSNKKSAFFGILAALLGLAVVILSFTCRNASPYLLGGAEQASRRVGYLLEDMKTCDLEVIAGYFPENVDLEKLYSTQNPVAQRLYRAVWESMDYTISDNAYGDTSGMAVDVDYTAIDAPKTLDAARALVQKLVKDKAEQAQDLDAVFDENNKYREDFLNRVLLEALEQVLPDAPTRREQLTVHIRKVGRSWQVLPEDSLMNALSGWIKD